MGCSPRRVLLIFQARLKPLGAVAAVLVHSPSWTARA